MQDSAQRATLVLERDPEEGSWFVVAYLVRDSGQRERKTVACHDSREAASAALETLWSGLLSQRLTQAA